MKKIIIVAALAATATPALAQGMTYFLSAQWIERGQRFCRYQNGTVLNVGINLCPLSIQG